MSRDFGRFSVPALDVVADATGDDPQCVVYASQAAGKIIICPFAKTPSGVYIEQNPLGVLPYDCSSEIVGQSIWESLLLFRKTPNVDLRAKKTDWPAYRASGAMSVLEFEEQYVRVTIRAFRCVLRVEAAVPTSDAEGLFVGRTITSACEFQALGELIRLGCRCSVWLAKAAFE